MLRIGLRFAGHQHKGERPGQLPGSKVPGISEIPAWSTRRPAARDLAVVTLLSRIGVFGTGRTAEPFQFPAHTSQPTGGPSLRARFAARPSAVPYTLPFPTHGYRKCLFVGISPAGRRGSLQLTRCRSHHVAADTPPVRTAVSDSFRRPLLPSRVIDRLGHRLIV